MFAKNFFAIIFDTTDWMRADWKTDWPTSTTDNPSEIEKNTSME